MSFKNYGIERVVKAEQNVFFEAVMHGHARRYQEHFNVSPGATFRRRNFLSVDYRPINFVYTRNHLAFSQELTMNFVMNSIMRLSCFDKYDRQFMSAILMSNELYYDDVMAYSLLRKKTAEKSLEKLSKVGLVRLSKISNKILLPYPNKDFLQRLKEGEFLPRKNISRIMEVFLSGVNDYALTLKKKRMYVLDDNCNIEEIRIQAHNVDTCVVQRVDDPEVFVEKTMRLINSIGRTNEGFRVAGRIAAISIPKPDNGFFVGAMLNPSALSENPVMWKERKVADPRGTWTQSEWRRFMRTIKKHLPHHCFDELPAKWEEYSRKMLERAAKHAFHTEGGEYESFDDFYIDWIEAERKRKDKRFRTLAIFGIHDCPFFVPSHASLIQLDGQVVPEFYNRIVDFWRELPNNYSEADKRDRLRHSLPRIIKASKTAISRYKEKKNGK